MSAPDFNTAAPVYRNRWASMTVTPSVKQYADKVARNILAHYQDYKAVADKVGCPWFFVGLVHYRESDLDFRTHLHNGDSLKHRTVHVPAGRPKTGSPPFAWADSAVDALTLEHENTFGSANAAEDGWTFGRLCYQLEAYNGWGYRNRAVTSAYLYSQSSQHLRGKFVRDGVYDPNALDEQLGTLVVLKSLLDLSQYDISFTDIDDAAPKDGVVPGDPAPPTTSQKLQAAVGRLQSWFTPYH